LVYSTQELEKIKTKGVFIVKADYLDEGYRTSITDQPISVG